MRGFVSIFSVFAVIGMPVMRAVGASSVTPFSQYGQIQNVQNYSSNPYWNPNGPYNQTFPRPVYVTGPDLNSGDCERTVFALVASVCAANNDCHGMQLSDIRPSVMLQLSRMPGHNWATQCMGYIDGAFSDYQSATKNRVPTTPTSFPGGATVSNPNVQTQEFKIKNPFASQTPDWAKKMQERKQELKDLQTANGSNDFYIVNADFPKRYEDLSFSERMQIQTDGYEVYKDASPYQSLTLLPADNTNTRQSTSTNTETSPAQAAKPEVEKTEQK